MIHVRRVADLTYGELTSVTVGMCTTRIIPVKLAGFPFQTGTMYRFSANTVPISLASLDISFDSEKAAIKYFLMSVLTHFEALKNEVARAVKDKKETEEGVASVDEMLNVIGDIGSSNEAREARLKMVLFVVQYVLVDLKVSGLKIGEYSELFEKKIEEHIESLKSKKSKAQ